MKTILIVDDDLATRRLISRILSHAKDLAVLTAANGKEATDIIEQCNVDLIITDIVMPEMDGFELLAYISEHCPEIPVFVMTAYESIEMNARIRALNIAQYFTKPLNMDEFKTRLFDELESGAEGLIRGISLVSFLQLVEMESKTCTLTIKSKADDRFGKLYFVKGDLISAEMSDLKNEEAVFEIISWEKATISIGKPCKKQIKEMTRPLLNILMEGIRLKDEKAAQQSAGKIPLNTNRKPERTASVPIHAAKAKFQASPASLAFKPQEHQNAASVAGVFEKASEILVFSLFNQEDAVIKAGEKPDIKPNTTTDIKPSIFFALSRQVATCLEFSIPISLMFNTQDGRRHLLFKYKDNPILATLRPGSSPITFLGKLKLINTDARIEMKEG